MGGRGESKSGQIEEFSRSSSSSSVIIIIINNFT